MKNEPLKPGDYVLAAKWHSGKPQDEWAVGFLSGIEVTAEGPCYRVSVLEGGAFHDRLFRKAKKISKKRGQWLEEGRELLMMSERSVWWCARSVRISNKGKALDQRGAKRDAS